MKKTLPTIIFLLVSTAVFSQGLKMGVAIEPGAGWLSAEAREVDNDEGRFSFAGGLILDNFFARNYAFSTGIFLGAQGGSLKYADSTSIHVYDEIQSLQPGTVVTYKLQYITVPVALKLKTNEIGYFTYFAQLGLTPQINVKSKADATADQLDDDNIYDEIKRFNLGYHFGGGIEYSISEDTAIVLGIIFHNGFMDITDNEDFRVTAKLLSFRLGVMF